MIKKKIIGYPFTDSTIQIPFGMYLTALHLVFEYSTPSLHVRWFLIKTGLGTSTVAILNDYLFVLLFFICRIICGPIFFYYYVKSIFELPWVSLNYVFFCSALVANALNYFWFSFIIRSAMVASPSQKKERFAKNAKKT